MRTELAGGGQEEIREESSLGKGVAGGMAQRPKAHRTVSAQTESAQNRKHHAWHGGGPRSACWIKFCCIASLAMANGSLRIMYNLEAIT